MYKRQFEDGLKLVDIRAKAMQYACEKNPSTMAAILGLEDQIVEKVCSEIQEIVVPANYNCPGQLVISGTNKGIDIACEKLTSVGARRALKLPVGGAFHSPLMELAKKELRINGWIKKSEDFDINIGVAVRIDKFSDSSIDMYVRCFTKSGSWNEWLSAKEKLAIGIKQIVENNKASFAFPSSSIYIEKK